MAGWTPDELRRIGDTDEMRLASRRPDGTLRPYVTIWCVRVDDDVYVRSAFGPDNPWFVRARKSGVGRILAGGVERDVSFVEPDADAHASIDAAYRAKYDRYGPRVVSSVLGDEVKPLTFRLVPRDA
jgi:hypothetical protein